MLNQSSHPCLRCGACCSSFRVAFYWTEAQPENPNGVPAELTAITRPHMLAMRGTDDGGTIRCIALRGNVGDQAYCNIYAQRPSPCRDLMASYEAGKRSVQCDRAREKFGLPPLQPSDWSTSSPPR